jgi:diadenosine tetraphosphatase ApaH/serine/threonine PP2A family protein phosphatase
VDVVAALCDEAVFGNHDARIRSDFAYAPSHRSAEDEHRVVTEALDEEEVRWLRELPKRVANDDYILAHSRPFYQRDPGYPVHGFAKGDYGVPPGDATQIGPHLDDQMALLGHTHRQHGVALDKFPGQSGSVVNPGSVGVPWYDKAQYAIVDTEAHTWDFYSAEYDNERVQRRLEH